MGQLCSATCSLAIIVVSMSMLQPSVFTSTGDSCSSADGGQNCPSASRDDKVHKFKGWLRGCGAKFSKVRIKRFKKFGRGVRGLAAAKEIRASEETISIPADCILTADHNTVLESPFARVTNASYIAHDGSTVYVGHVARLHAFLAAELRRLRDGDASSTWGPMLRMLPTPEEYAEFLPLYAHSSLLEMFAALPMVMLLRLHIDAHMQMWERHGKDWAILAKKHGASGLSFEDYTWAKAVLQTRAHPAPWSSANNALVPLSDLSNIGGLTGTAPPTLRWTDALTGSPPALRIKTNADLAAGAELTQFYGRLDNSELLLRFGFVVPGNDDPLPEHEDAESFCKSLDTSTVSSSIKDVQPRILQALQALTHQFCAGDK